MAAKTNTFKKTGNSIPLEKSKLALYEAPAKTLLKPAESIPVFLNSKTGQKALVARVADLPRIQSRAVALGLPGSIDSVLDQRIDYFAPSYAGGMPHAGKFYLRLCVSSYANTDHWRFMGSNRYSMEQISFDFLDRPDSWYYLEFYLRLAYCKLTVKVGTASSQLALDTEPATPERFGIFVQTMPSAFSPLIELSLDPSLPGNGLYDLALRSVVLYRTVRLPDRNTL